MSQFSQMSSFQDLLLLVMVDPVHLFLSLCSETVFEFAATAGKAFGSGFLA